ncbi:hypothetical protein E5206_01420 [Arthrobacter sp. PAMC25564]|uniref:hypothetical protein n=1 Tax=Arthrobacter sp. PAMC25564 TaxID=2565366 RepID=UPI0010A202CC|nr:hypothetical protein [Arthrobacter sp. PAMC25564]QCB95750.1 hypothetical protein E5206_01420 [Arthrobacter sp. PAMC25564]
MRPIRQFLSALAGAVVLAFVLMGAAGPDRADGPHPVDGSFPFTVTAGAAGPTATAAVPTMGTPQPGTTVAPENAPSSAEPFPWSLVIFVGTAVGILVALGLMAKRRLDPDDGAAGPDNGGAEPGSGSPGH